VTVAWAVFWIGGLPDYYRQYSDGFMIVFDLAILLPLWYVVLRVLKRVRRGSRLMVAGWLAFYITVPLLLYDVLYCGVYLGYGAGFVVEFWYLSVYYIVPWIILPPTGLWLDRRPATGRPSA
jgi:hypothetical protein